MSEISLKLENDQNISETLKLPKYPLNIKKMIEILPKP